MFNKKPKKSDIVKNMNPWVQCRDIDNCDNNGVPKKKSGCVVINFFKKIFKQ